MAAKVANSGGVQSLQPPQQHHQARTEKVETSTTGLSYASVVNPKAASAPVNTINQLSSDSGKSI